MPDYRNIQHTALPADTRNLLSLDNVENFALLLQRCVHFLPQKPDSFSDKTPPLRNRVEHEPLKAQLFIRDKLNVCAGWKPENKSAFMRYLHSYKQTIANLCADKCLYSFNMQTAWRVAIGLGGGSVYENGITLHHIYGVPYLPASSLKGVSLRAYWEKFGKNTQEESLIFGTDAAQGKVLFFDAFPNQLIDDMIGPDIMNNHYQDYYEGPAPPADWHSPNPVFFLTMKNTSVDFQIGITDSQYMPLLERTRECLEYAMINIGIGAKTAVGYGLFRTK